MPSAREVPQVSGRDHVRSSLGRRGKDKAVAGVRQKEPGNLVDPDAQKVSERGEVVIGGE